MAKIKGVDYEDGEITVVYIEDMSNIKKFNIDKKQFGINVKRKSSLAPSIWNALIAILEIILKFILIIVLIVVRKCKE